MLVEDCSFAVNRSTYIWHYITESNGQTLRAQRLVNNKINTYVTKESRALRVSISAVDLGLRQLIGAN